MVSLEATVNRIVFRNQDNGWTVLHLTAGKEDIPAVGVLPMAMEGAEISLEGEWVTHPEYGRQLRIERAFVKEPTSSDAIEKYLVRSKIAGVGKTTAKRIVKAFGKDTLRVLDEESEKLLDLPGFSRKKVAQIVESFRAKRAQLFVMANLCQFDLPPAVTHRIYDAFGDQAAAVIRANPYILAQRIEGVGFQTADRIAFSVGIGKDSPERIRSGLEFVLDEAVYQDGHTCLPEAELKRKAASLLEIPEETLGVLLKEMALSGSIVCKSVHGETLWYTGAAYRAETHIAKLLCALTKTFRPDEASENVDRRIEHFEAQGGVQLGEAQRKAVRQAALGAVTIITGGPGTGKTTSIRCIIDTLKDAGIILLCAPTGRAAKRMQEATGQEASTIHKMLSYSGEDVFEFDEDNPLEASTVIVDEMSMVDIFLMRSLLRAVKPGSRLILVGDADQLPSVGAGNVLHDLCESGAIPLIRLDEVFRQAQESMIVTNAHRINHGEMPVVNKNGSDFFMQRVNDPQSALETVLSLIAQRLPNYLGVPWTQIQVISPMKKGETGVWQLNAALQMRLNPPSEERGEIARERGIFREGDKVMQIKNNYQLEWETDESSGKGVFNGDLGFISHVDTEDESLTVTFEDGRRAIYESEMLSDLELAYAMTVHKSQGSEFTCVVMPVMGGPEMLMTRNLLYTAVTRAKKLVVLVGRDACVWKMVENDHITQRYSTLKEHLEEAFRL